MENTNYEHESLNLNLITNYDYAIVWYLREIAIELAKINNSIEHLDKI